MGLIPQIVKILIIFGYKFSHKGRIPWAIPTKCGMNEDFLGLLHHAKFQDYYRK